MYKFVHRNFQGIKFVAFTPDSRTVVGMSMTYDEALMELARKSGADAMPKLTTDELIDYLAQSEVMDENGTYPGEDDWLPTWNTNIGAAAGWLTKAGRASEGFTSNVDGIAMNRDQVFKQCMEMYKVYSAKVNAIVLAPVDYGYPYWILNWNAR